MKTGREEAKSLKDLKKDILRYWEDIKKSPHLLEKHDLFLDIKTQYQKVFYKIHRPGRK